MALNFPDSPTLNQIYTDSTSGFSYQWNGTVWISFTPSSTGNIKVLDDISGSFNGSTQTFALTSSTIALAPPNPQSVIVNLGGVVQDPSDDYTISGSNIIFSTPPTAGLTFSGIVLGVAVPVGISTADAYYRQIYTPTGVQTSFNFVNGYTVGYLDVYHNGAKLVPATDYTATDGLNFSLITAAQSGDVVEAIGYRVSAVTIVNGNLNSLTVSGISSLAGATNLGSTLNVTGVSTLGTVRIASGIVTASSGIVTYYGDGSNLNLTGNTTAGVTSTSSVNTVGVVTAGIIDSFIPVDQKLVSTNLTINNGQENISFAEELVVDTGSIFTVSAGSTVRMNALDTINASIVSASVDLDIPSGTIAQRPSAPTSGSFRYNSTYGILEFYDGTNWRLVSLGEPLFSSSSSIGVFGGGSSPINVIDYITIETTGNAANFGTLTGARQSLAACSSIARGVFGGGFVPATPSGISLSAIDYVAIISRGTATNFGTLTGARYNLAACSSSTRGVFGGGNNGSNIIDYITIASTGDAIDFGDLTVARGGIAACSSSTRGVFGGGYFTAPFPGTPSIYATIDYINFTSVGNATNFGSLSTNRRSLAACSSSTRGVFGGGYTPSLTNVIDFITIASTGSATDFGDLTTARSGLAACSSSTRGVFGSANIMDYITIASTGNALNFGSFSTSRSGLAACSNAHGGLS
jgi:hypothetical protein